MEFYQRYRDLEYVTEAYNDAEECYLEEFYRGDLMSDIGEIQEYSRIRELGTNSQSGGHLSSPYYKAHYSLKQRSKSPARTHRQIQDTSFVMGIPLEEITPRVHEAMTLIMHEMDSVRWELGAIKKHETFLIEALYYHQILPAVSLHSFRQYLVRAVEHVQRTREKSFLLFLKVLKVDDLWEKNGARVRDDFLIHTANMIRSCIEDVDVIGALDHGEFGVIFNLYQEDAVIAKGNALVRLLSTSPFVFDGVECPVNLIWGFSQISVETDPDQMISIASDNARK